MLWCDAFCGVQDFGVQCSGCIVGGWVVFMCGSCFVLVRSGCGVLLFFGILLVLEIC